VRAQPRIAASIKEQSDGRKGGESVEQDLKGSLRDEVNEALSEKDADHQGRKKEGV